MRLLMLYDMLLGRGKIDGGGKAVRAMKEWKEALADSIGPEALAAAKAAAGSAHTGAGGGVEGGTATPRYVRCVV